MVIFLEAATTTRHNLIEGVTLPLTLPFKSIDKMTVLIDYSPKIYNKLFSKLKYRLFYYVVDFLHI
jgi:hypothetical protein